MNDKLKNNILQLLDTATCVQLDFSSEAMYQCITVKFNQYSYYKGGTPYDEPKPEIPIKHESIKNILETYGEKISVICDMGLHEIYLLGNDYLNYLELTLLDYGFDKISTEQVQQAIDEQASKLF